MTEPLLQPLGRKRRQPRGRDLPRREWERLVRERPFQRPLPAPLPLHVMGRLRGNDRTTETERNAP